MGVLDGGAHRHLEHHVHAVAAVAVVAATGLAVLGVVVGLEAVVEQGRVVLVGLQKDRAALAAVAARGAAAGHELLTPEGDRTLPAVASLHVDAHFVDEFHGQA